MLHVIYKPKNTKQIQILGQWDNSGPSKLKIGYIWIKLPFIKADSDFTPVGSSSVSNLIKYSFASLAAYVTCFLTQSQSWVSLLLHAVWDYHILNKTAPSTSPLLSEMPKRVNECVNLLMFNSLAATIERSTNYRSPCEHSVMQIRQKLSAEEAYLTSEYGTQWGQGQQPRLNLCRSASSL